MATPDPGDGSGALAICNKMIFPRTDNSLYHLRVRHAGDDAKSLHTLSATAAPR